MFGCDEGTEKDLLDIDNEGVKQRANKADSNADTLVCGCEVKKSETMEKKMDACLQTRI